MARYIDAEKLYRKVKEETNPYGKPTLDYESGVKVLNMIKQEPTADVVEVKRGEWIYHECVSSYDGAKSGYSCSVCSAFVNDEVFESDGFHKDFCGHCGADTRGDNDVL